MSSQLILSSSVAERSTVNRLVVGSNPTWGVLNLNLAMDLLITIVSQFRVGFALLPYFLTFLAVDISHLITPIYLASAYKLLIEKPF